MVKIGNDNKIGNNNAIGEKAKVKVNTTNEHEEKKIWFVRHPWMSAIICSILASIIYGFWDKIISLFKL